MVEKSGCTRTIGYGNGQVEGDVAPGRMTGKRYVIQRRGSDGGVGASIRAVRNSYAKHAGVDSATAPTPLEIEEIALGTREGNADAARAAYRELGEIVGEALCTATSMFDGLLVIGGGLSAGHRLFMPGLLDAMRGTISTYDGSKLPRLVQKIYNLEDAGEQAEFVKGEVRMIALPGSDDTLAYDPLKRIGIGVSVLGTSEAVGIGAYAYALNQLDGS